MFVEEESKTKWLLYGRFSCFGQLIEKVLKGGPKSRKSLKKTSSLEEILKGVIGTYPAGKDSTGENQGVWVRSCMVVCWQKPTMQKLPVSKELPGKRKGLKYKECKRDQKKKLGKREKDYHFMGMLNKGKMTEWAEVWNTTFASRRRYERLNTLSTNEGIEMQPAEE